MISVSTCVVDGKHSSLSFSVFCETSDQFSYMCFIRMCSFLICKGGGGRSSFRCCEIFLIFMFALRGVEHLFYDQA